MKPTDMNKQDKLVKTVRQVLTDCVENIENGLKDLDCSFEEIRADGIRYKVAQELAFAVIDYSSPQDIKVPSSILFEGKSCEVAMVYVKDDTHAGTVIDIGRLACEVRIQKNYPKVILRVNQLYKDLGQCFRKNGIPRGFHKFNNLILKAPEYSSRKNSSGLVFLTNLETDEEIGIPVQIIEDVSGWEREVYSGRIITSSIRLKKKSGFNTDDFVGVYESPDMVVAKLAHN